MTNERPPRVSPPSVTDFQEAMERTRRFSLGPALLLITFALAVPSLAVASGGPAPVATYLFQNTFAAEQSGVPALVKVDPLGASVFEDSVVFGQVRRVFHFDGDSTPAQQAGLSLDTTGLIAPNTYSVEMVMEFTERDGSWRRLIDVQARQSDCGFYVDSGNKLDVFCAGGGGAVFTTGAYHHVVLTNGGGVVRGYLDGTLQFTVSTTVMNMADASNVMNFFLDNVAAGGQGEFADGRVALIRVYASALTDLDVAALAAVPFPAAPGALVYDLKADWSDTSNPNGAWSYNQGTTPLPHLDNWPLGESMLQPAWAYAAPPTFGHIPSWLQVKQNVSPNMQAGDVGVHTPDPFNAFDPNTPAAAVWTSPSAGTVVVTGDVWYAGDAIADRPQDWSLVVNGATMAGGVLVHGAAHTTRADPATFTFAGEVFPGEKISLVLRKDPSSTFGWFVGMNLTITLTPVLAPPLAPSGLTATVVGSTQVALAWTDGSNNESGFQIERRTVAGYVRIATVGANARTFTDTRAAPNTVYTYRVRAANSAGVSPYTNEATASLLLGKLVVRQRLVSLNTRVGKPATAQLQVRNDGKATLTGSVGSLSAPFAVTSGSGTFSLAPGASQIVTIRFSSATRGTFSAALTISDQTPGASPIPVTMTGSAR